MAKSDSAPKHAFQNGNFSPEEISENLQKPSIEIIAKHFEHNRDLSVVQIQDTIIYQSTDIDKGATRFIQLFNSLIGKRGPFVPSFEVKWLVSDGEQLRHVILETKNRARGLFNTLAAHASVAIVKNGSESHQMITHMYKEFDAETYKTITAFPSDSGRGYDCHGHFMSSTAQNGHDGALCTFLPKTPDELTGLLEKLHLAHVERITLGNGDLIQDFESKEISIISLEKLIA